MLEGRNRLQSDLDRLRGCADGNRMGFNTFSAEAEKDLGVITGAKMNMGRQCGDAVRKANRTLSCIHRCVSGRSQEVIFPLYVALVRPQLDYCIQF